MFLSVQIKDTIIKCLRNELDPKFIYLFGSFSQGEGRKDSDIDLGVYLDENIDPYDLFTIANNLSNKVNRDVQLINLREINPVFAAQIVSTKEILFCDDEVLMSNYDIRVLKEYAMLNRERQVVLDAIEEDGRIYGKRCYTK